MTPRVALTGGTGFLGQHVLTAFAAAGWRVRVLARRPEAVPASAAVETVKGALSDSEALAALVEGADAVVHLAGAIRARNRAGFMAVNRDGTAALAAATAAGAPEARVVLVSSMAAREPQVSHYAASKAAGEAALAATPAGADAVILRPSVIYGPGDGATLPMFRAACWPVQPVLNGPAARVALIHVADVVTAITAAAARPGLPAGTWELTDAHREGYSWAEIVDAACRACGKAGGRPVRVPAALLRLGGLGGEIAALAGAAPMLTLGKVREILHTGWGSDDAAQPPSALWYPARDIENGFAETAAWYRTAGWLGRCKSDAMTAAKATE